MTEKPLVSVLMTAYNRELYIAEAIESVLASTYENFELIIVDDGSKDSTVTIARRYETTDSRVKVYVNEQNLGDYHNRNKSVSYAKGKYIKYWDSDDIIYPHCLDVMVRCMEQFPTAAFGLIKPHMPGYTMPYPFLIEKPFEEYIRNQQLFSNSPGSAIINRDAFNKIGGFSGKRYIGDFEFWLKISQVSPLVIVPGFLGWDRTHANQERNFEEVAYAKMGIDVLIDAFNTSEMPDAQALKREIVAKRKATAQKLILKEILALRFTAAYNKYKIMSYLLKKAE